MPETNGDQNALTDSLAQIVRAAGRRPVPPREHYESVYAATHAVWQRQLSRKRHRRWYAMAAAIAVLALGATLWQTLQTSSTGIAAYVEVANGRVEQLLPDDGRWAGVTGSDVPVGSRIRTGTDGSVALRLADGGSLRLNSETELVIEGASIALNDGTVYFDSAGRVRGTPIDVVTALGTVRDIGTQFEVRASRSTLRVRVRSGSIAVLDSPASQPLASQSGEEIELSADGDVSRRGFAPDDPQWSWAQALASAPDFDTPTVLAYLSWIASETGKQLRFASENVRLQAELSRFLGDPTGLMPNELLITITATSDFDYELMEDGSILISRSDQLR